MHIVHRNKSKFLSLVKACVACVLCSRDTKGAIEGVMNDKVPSLMCAAVWVSSKLERSHESTCSGCPEGSRRPQQ